MIKRLIESIVLWVIVAILVYLLGSLLLAVDIEITQSIGDFLVDTSALWGFLAGLAHFFFGTSFRIR